MRQFRHHSALIALLLTAGSAVAQAQDGDWVNYRDAYRKMVVFEKYGKAKNFIQNYLQVVGADKGASPEGLQLTLQGKTVRLNLPLDATGRTVFPLLKVAYDENAVLALNRKPSQYQFKSRVSIVLRPDGVYEAADLRAACEQALAYQRYVDASARSARCAGVRFVYAKGVADPGVTLRKGEAAALPATDGPAYPGDPYDGFRVVNYRFGDAAAKEQIVTPNVPLAVNPVFE